MQRNIYLVGLMGAGKTTVGRKLAGATKTDFIDTDQLLESRTGVSISHIFELEGEKGFRDRETAMLQEVASNPPYVISTGGGVVLKAENREIMKNSGQVIYLRASLGLLWGRLKGCKKRPLLQVENPKGKIKQLIEERDSIYLEAADIVVDVSSESASKMVRKVQEMLERHENS